MGERYVATMHRIEVLNTMSVRTEIHKPRKPNGHGHRWLQGERRINHDDITGLTEINTSEIDSLLTELGEPVEESRLHFDEVDNVADEFHAEERSPRTPARFHRETSGPITDMWMVRSGKAPLLTAAQELVLAKRVEHGDQSAKDELVERNIRLVASVARRYLGRGLPLEDLMQEGIIGLLRAIEKYNYRKGYRFSTYATHWIRQSVSRSLANQGRSIRLPAHVVDSIGRIVRVREELFQRLGRPPSRIEVADAAGITEKKLLLLLRSAAQPVSLDTPVGTEGDARLGDFIPADDESSPSDRAFRYLVHDELEHALKSLTPREREVIMLRYGLFGLEQHTLEETGRKLHITRERSRQIEAKAMEKLKRHHTVGRLAEALA
jgi:RNA polymerase primary sigma factor